MVTRRRRVVVPGRFQGFGLVFVVKRRDEALAGAFGDAELPCEAGAEAGGAVAVGVGLLDEGARGVEARVVGVGVRCAAAGAGARRAAGGVPQWSAVGVGPYG